MKLIRRLQPINRGLLLRFGVLLAAILFVTNLQANNCLALVDGDEGGANNCLALVEDDHGAALENDRNSDEPEEASAIFQVNPLAPPNTRLQGPPPETKKKPPPQNQPSQQLRWTKTTTPKPSRPSLNLTSGRVVAAPTEHLLALSPDGDAAALRDPQGHVRIIQLLNGRVSPYLPMPKQAHLSLAVSGFAAVISTARYIHRIHPWSSRILHKQTIPPPPHRKTTHTIAIAPDARHAAILLTPKPNPTPPTKQCIQLFTLGGDAQQHTTCWPTPTSTPTSHPTTQLTFSDDGERLWAVTAPSSTSPKPHLTVVVINAQTAAIIHQRTFPSVAPPFDRICAVPGISAISGRFFATPTATSKHNGNPWRFDLNDQKIQGTSLLISLHTSPTQKTGVAVPIRGGRSWVSLQGNRILQYAPGGGFIEDGALLPQAVHNGRKTLADDGRHIAVTTTAGLLLWDVLRSRPVAWLPSANRPHLARSRALWRDAAGRLRTATWQQLEAILPGLHHPTVLATPTTPTAPTHHPLDSQHGRVALLIGLLFSARQ